MKNLKQQRGFTVIELMVVAVIVGILLTLVLTTHAGIAQKERNTERERDIAELRDGLEAYYYLYSKYPTLTELNNTSWRSTNMKSIDKEVYRDPSGKSYNLIAKPAKAVYAYAVTSASGIACNNIKVACSQYTLTATLEGGGTYVKNNLN
jgi:prepilin-type N-terminal cleavage/methylation domain-containing protein